MLYYIYYTILYCAIVYYAFLRAKDTYVKAAIIKSFHDLDAEYLVAHPDVHQDPASRLLDPVRKRHGQELD